MYIYIYMYTYSFFQMYFILYTYAVETYIYIYILVCLVWQSGPPFGGWRCLPIPCITVVYVLKHVNGRGCGLSACVQYACTVLWGGCHSRLRGIQVIDWCSRPASSSILLFVFSCLEKECIYIYISSQMFDWVSTS